MNPNLGWLKTPYEFSDKEEKRLDRQKITLGFNYLPCNFSFLGTHGLKIFNYSAFMNV